MDSGQLSEIKIEDLLGIDKPNRKFRFCQNILCGVRNTNFLGKYCSIMCADCDEGEITAKEWVEMHYQFWANSKIPKE